MKVFIGYDPRQPIAFQVCAQSVWEHASKPVDIVRLDLRTLPIQRRGLTEFTYSRFLVPYLSNFEGYSLFLDSDILVRTDVHDILELQSYCESNVSMVMHEGRERFERASVMLFDNKKCKQLTPEYVQQAPCFDYAWASSPYPLPKEWNHLVFYNAPNPAAKIVHYTAGIPIWEQTRNCEFADEWHATHRRMNSSVSYAELMGPSVHAARIAKLVPSA